MRLLLLAGTSGLVLLPGPAHAKLKAPEVGTRMVWECNGPYSKRYDLKVVRVDDDIVRYEGVVDGQPYYSEKHAALTGTSLWYRLSGQRTQRFDMEDFEDFRELVPGSRFKGAIPAEQKDDKWVWDYQVNVGQPRAVNHRVLGKVLLVPVSERRKVFHGSYWSKMTTYILPEAGISVSWIYEDPKGVERCDLAALER